MGKLKLENIVRLIKVGKVLEFIVGTLQSIAVVFLLFWHLKIDKKIAAIESKFSKIDSIAKVNPDALRFMNCDSAFAIKPFSEAK